MSHHHGLDGNRSCLALLVLIFLGPGAAAGLLGFWALASLGWLLIPLGLIAVGLLFLVLSVMAIAQPGPRPPTGAQQAFPPAQGDGTPRPTAPPPLPRGPRGHGGCTHHNEW
jgi:hypothetical protein